MSKAKERQSVEIYVYRQGAEGVEQINDRSMIGGLLKDETNLVWVDLRGETPEDLATAEEILKNDFNFHSLTIEDCLENRNQPKIEAFPNYLYFIVHGVRPEQISPSNFATKELDGYLGKNYVVTFHREPFATLKEVKRQVRTSTFACQRGPSYLLHQILDQLVDHYMPLVDTIDDEINDLEEKVIASSKSDNATLQDIMNLRRGVARLKRVSARQLQVLYRLSHGEFPQIPDNVLPYFRDVYDHLLRISDLSESYRDLISGLFDSHFAVVANRTNEIMKTLAIVSAVILPLSLIAGIYGMNFDYMPELKTRFGYFATLGAMVVITLLLLLYFWQRGWIFQRSQNDEEHSPTLDSDQDAVRSTSRLT
jgi:magnesium transporter